MTKSPVWMRLLIVGVIALPACEAGNPMSPGPVHSSLTDSNATAAVQAATMGRPGSATVRLCHVTGNGRYQPLTVAEHAEAAHRAHGDARVGEAVPTAPGMVFDESCQGVGRSFALTSGSWMTSLGTLPRFSFDAAGDDILLSGTWDQALPGPSAAYTAGTVVTITSVFQNPIPQTIVSFARGTAVVAGTTYAFVEFGGDLTFITDPITIPTPAPTEVGQQLTVTVPFRMSGVLKGYEVLNRRDPLLVFEIPLSGNGTATLDLLSGPAGSLSLTTGRLTYAFIGS